jgi:hypothetical protein
MALEHLTVEEITQEHLNDLLDSGVPESRNLDYKRDLYGRKDEDKKELLADISALANTDGGHIIIGISETAGLPEALVGIGDAVDTDDEKQFLENVALSGLRPVVQGLRVHAVPLDVGSHIIVVRVPRSLNAPHRVTYKGSNRFYARASSRKYEPEVDELRAMFLALPELSERLQAFHEKRLVDMIAADQMPFALPLDENGLLVVHVMPLGALSFGAHHATAPDLLEDDKLLKPPVSGFDHAHAARPTFEGVLTRYTSGTTNVGYVQAWRNGIIEGVAIRAAVIRHRDSQDRRWPVVNSRDLEKRIVGAVLAYSEKLERAGFHPPLAIFTAMLNAQKAILHSDDLGHDPTPFGRDRMSFAPAVAGEFLKDPEACAQLLRPAFDQIANAGGLDVSPTFAQDDTWKLAAEMEGHRPVA